MTNYLNAAEIASMRGDVDNLILDMTCDVARHTPGAEDSHGHLTPGTWAVTENNIKCHYWEQAEEELVGTPNARVTRERVLLPAGTDVHTGDRIDQVIGYDGAEVATGLDILEVLKREFDTLLIVRSIQ